MVSDAFTLVPIVHSNIMSNHYLFYQPC
jgi:hypothetical protein